MVCFSSVAVTNMLITQGNIARCWRDNSSLCCMVWWHRSTIRCSSKLSFGVSNLPALLTMSLCSQVEDTMNSGRAAVMLTVEQLVDVDTKSLQLLCI